MTTFDFPMVSDRNLQDAILMKLKEVSKDQHSRGPRGARLGAIADTALAIHEFRPIKKLRPLVVNSCEATYCAIVYTEQTFKDEANEHMADEIEAKLIKLTGTLGEVRKLGSRMTSRCQVAAAFMWCFGFRESRRIQRLQATLKDMIIHEFGPKDLKKFSIRDMIYEARELSYN